MEYKCCKYIRNGLYFAKSGIHFCGNLSSISKESFVSYQKNFHKKFLDKKKSIIKKCQKNIFPVLCSDCAFLEKKEWDDTIDLKINYIELYHWYQCNCSCIYCANRKQTHLKRTNRKSKSEYVDLYGILKDLVNDGFFSDDLTVAFGGGEPTLLKEFNNILKLFMRKNYKVHILTNGILYEKLFAEALKKNKFSGMTISIDCSDREKYKKIKGVDKFDDVVKNIKRYIKDSCELSHNVIIKYIIIEGLNDSEEEVIKWLELCKEIGVKTLHPAIEYCHSAKDQSKIGPSENLCHLYNFMKEKIVEYGFNLNVYDFLEEIIKNKRYR